MHKPVGGTPTYSIDFYFEQVTNIESLSQLSIGDKLTIGLFWNVDSTGSGSGSGSGNTEIERLKYKLYDLVTIIPTGYTTVSKTNKDGYSVTDPNGDKKTYYVVEKTVNFADYFIVSAGEPTFTFDGKFAGTEVQVPYSEVIADDTLLNKLLAREIPKSNVTYSDLVKYIEMLEYSQYNTFSKEKEDFIKAQSYMQYGLTINVIFDLKVSQVD